MQSKFASAPPSSSRLANGPIFRHAFPLGLGVDKTFKLGALPPIQTSLEFQWMAWHPADFGQRYNLRFVFKPVLPAMVKKPIFD